MLKKLIIWGLLSLLIFAYPLLSAAKDSNSIEKIINTIKNEQKSQQIDVEKVSEKQLENLGKALSKYYHPNPKEHKYMQEMMGGKNSPSLKSMYQMMGYRYLQGKRAYYGKKEYPMSFGFRQRGYHMRAMRYNNNDYTNHSMGRGPGFGYHRMGYGPRDHYNGGMSFFHRGFGGGILFWILLIIIIAGLFFIIQKVAKNKEGFSTKSDNALEILKKRYAKGEISKEEYEEIKKEL